MRVSCGDGCREVVGGNGAGGWVVSIGSGGDEVEMSGTPAVRKKCNGRESVNEKARREKKRYREKRRERRDCTVLYRTSEELAEVKSGGTSRDAGVTLASLGLSLVNNFRMGEE
jgi:hypothetical protein